MARLEVRYNSGAQSLLVGHLATIERRIYFQYDSTFRQHGLELSPLHLPTSIVEPVEDRERAFAGLHGLFNDSLPDGWGMIVMNRALRAHGIDARQITPLDRLAFIGARGMGALTYHPPSERGDGEPLDVDLTEVAAQSARVLEGSAEDLLPELVRAGGSPMGARPKILVGVRADGGHLVTGVAALPAGYRHWLIKFTARDDAKDAGAIEMAYAAMARSAGVAMPTTRLFVGRDGRSHFGVERFDRNPADPATRIHVHTLSGFLHANHAIPGQDYGDLLTATRALTRDHRDVVEAFRRMVFNLLAHNRDDHTKNFAYLMTPDGEWHLSPAYDLTLSFGPGGEHTMTVAGEGRNPTRGHALSVASGASISPKQASGIIAEVEGAIGDWPVHARGGGVSRQSIAIVRERLDAVRVTFNSSSVQPARRPTGMRRKPRAT